jgi:hypothetical protein
MCTMSRHAPPQYDVIQALRHAELQQQVPHFPVLSTQFCLLAVARSPDCDAACGPVSKIPYGSELAVFGSDNEGGTQSTSST